MITGFLVAVVTVTGKSRISDLHNENGLTVKLTLRKEGIERKGQKKWKSRQ